MIARKTHEYLMQAKRLTSQRTLTHLLLGGMVMALFLGVAWLVPAGKGYNLLLITLGYLSLLLVGMTLLIGPLNLLRQRHNPVNIYLRRDIGIWAGITGCLHVLLVLRGNIQDSEALLFFLRRETGGYTPLLTLYGLSNDAGLFATFLLLLLLALSNTFALRLLKGKRWKLLQRLTYLLIILSALHTLGFQLLNLRVPLLFAGLFALSALILAFQVLGVALTLARRKQRW